MHLVCLDLEGVLIPEIWINFAEDTGLSELRMTTRDEPDYNVLMRKRLAILDREGLKLPDIQKVIGGMDPLPGAMEFLEELRSKTQVIILSDTFEEFAKPLMKKLRWPTLFCNSLVVDGEGRITDFTLRQQDGKRKAVEAFKSTGTRLFAAGDSYNDVTMLLGADKGALFKSPLTIQKEFPQLPAVDEYGELMSLIDDFIKS
ncbi:MAG: bifunctional phosphoserine phosphatase/homoserine phosphotransferase ThrH [Spirochaetales bacterium]|nr:bifunctional phosphoserine phosphatase/homoserine phosphotransferase ThrH [Spirochaetales bacterium]